MDKSKYDMATAFRKRIEHVDRILIFLRNVQERDLIILMQETGFVSRPEKFICEKADIETLIRAFENDKKELEEAFNAL